MNAVPTAIPAYVGPFTWDDGGWRCCLTCDVEWGGDGPCFLEPSHPGVPGRLRSWCRHGLRRVPGAGLPVCPWCQSHAPSDFTTEFLDALAIIAERVRASVG